MARVTQWNLADLSTLQPIRGEIYIRCLPCVL